MAKADPTRNVRHSISLLLPPRPVASGNRRLVRFLALALVSLLVVILALSLLSSIGAPKDFSIGVALAWMAFLAIASPVAIVLGQRDRLRTVAEIREWDADPRRLAIEQLGMDLTAGRITAGLSGNDLVALNDAAGDWRHSRDALEALTWARGDLAQVRNSLRSRLDEAMRNLLAEAGAGHPLGPSPFLIERARKLFGEVGAEANAMSRSHSSGLFLETDESLESLRDDLDRLKEMRIAVEDATAAKHESLAIEGH